HTYRLGVNQFSDITDEEYRQMLTLDVSALEGQQTYDKKPYSIKAQLPESVDWRTKNVVSAVKNQGSCGSCFAFASVDTIESAHAIKTGTLVTLSPQNVIDCMGNPGVCTQGSYMHLAFEFIIKEGGLDKEESYPYKGVYHKCSYQAQYSGASITGYANVTSGDEDALQEAIATNGPVVVGIDASLSTFRSYKSGVYNDKKCKNAFRDLHHAVVAVGYGTENGQDYYIVKNSWATTYGDHGYIKMARNANNHCGIATYALYPTGTK
ncbi:unnamed protein product, partial [Oppiella nova]